MMRIYVSYMNEHEEVKKEFGYNECSYMQAKSYLATIKKEHKEAKIVKEIKFNGKTYKKVVG